MENSLHPYRVCVLAYRRVAETVREVIKELPQDGIEYLVMESGLAEEQAACVAEARRLGCEIFVAGPAGAALFSSQYSYPVIPFKVSDLDYLKAIRTALNEGYRQIGIMRYRYSPALDLPLYSHLLQAELTELIYEEIPQIYEMVRKTDCDLIIGPAAAQDAADSAGKASLLVYAGEEAIREACLAAGEEIKKIYETRRTHLIAEASLNTTQLGIVVTDAQQHIEFFNHTMQNYTSLSLHQAMGRPLSELFPNLPIKRFLQSGFTQTDSFHLINGTMMRCVLRRLTVGTHPGGLLLSFHPNPHNRKKDRRQPAYKVAPVYRLEKITAHSAAMNELVRICHQISPVEYPVLLLGPAGSGREELAHCLHNASRRAENPCITLDCAHIMDEEAVTILYGYRHKNSTTNGLLLNAIGGSIILKHPGLAGPRLLSLLQDALVKRQFFQPGMEAPLTLDILFYTVAAENEFRQLPPVLSRLLSILTLTLPALKNRPEDIGDLFTSYVRQQLPQKRDSQVTDKILYLLQAYSWPGNIVELRTVSTRYALRLKNAASHTARYRYQCLLEAIGPERIRQDIIQQHPSLRPPVTDTTDFCQGINRIRKIFGDTYEDIAKSLDISRTTLWRLLKKDNSVKK